MEKIRIYAGSSDSDRESNSPPKRPKKVRSRSKSRQSIYSLTPIPTPPSELESIPNAMPSELRPDYGGRKRSFPHVDGNFPVHLSIPRIKKCLFFSVNITLGAKNLLEALLGKTARQVPGLRGMDDDIVVNYYKRRDSASGSRPTSSSRIEIAKEYHISVSRTVPIRVHQIETLVPHLRHRFQHQSRYWIEFGKWEVFVNDEGTRTFLALEVVSAGLSEIRKQIALVNDVFKLHGLPPFYESPRPHISVAYAVGNVSGQLAPVAAELNEFCGNTVNYGGKGLINNVLWSHLFGRLECKIGQHIYPIWVATSPTHI